MLSDEAVENISRVGEKEVAATLKKSTDEMSGLPALIPEKHMDITTEAAREGIAPRQYRKLMNEKWEELTAPLRYDMIKKHTANGTFNAQGFLNEMEKNAKTPELYEQIFGSKENVNEAMRFIRAVAHAQNKPTGTNIFIKLTQAGQATAVVGGVAGAAFFADSPELKMGTLAGGALLFLSPYALARAFTNKRLMQALATGVEDGVRSTRFMSALRRFGEMQYVQKLREQASEKAIQHYTDLTPNPNYMLGAPSEQVRTE